MKERSTQRGRISDRGRGLGLVTEEMVRRRAREIAVINGRNENHVLDSDLTQARRELTGEERLVPTPTEAELLPEEERWDPVPGTPGKTGAPAVPAPDEQTVAEELVEEGVEDAEHDQMLRATRQRRKRDKQQ